MATSKKNHQQHQAPEAAIQEAIGKTEGFIERNSKTLGAIVVAIAVVVCGYFGWKYLYIQPRAEKATAAMFVAEQQFAASEWQLALEGDGKNAGFLEITDSYGSTPVGNLARHYAGICYLKMDKPDEALDMLSKYKTVKGAPAKLVNSQNFGLRGDIYVQKEQYKEALEMFRKAVDASSNQLITPYYLKKAGLVAEKLGDKASAIAFYQRIADEFAMSMEARDIEKNIGKAQQE